MSFWAKKQQRSKIAPDEVFEKLRNFIAIRSTIVTNKDAITRDTRLFSSGLLDSLAYAELVFFVEETMGVALSAYGDVTMDRLDRLGDAVELIVEASS